MASSEARPPPPPRALLFDIGGVCVPSPLLAIQSYERANALPSNYLNFAIARAGNPGAWFLLERGLIPLDDAFFRHLQADLTDPLSWRVFHARGGSAGEEAAPARMPEIDAREVFWTMMRVGSEPDVHMREALKRLKASGRFVLGALSNNVAFPQGVRDEKGRLVEVDRMVMAPSSSLSGDLLSRGHGLFDAFVGSAQVGIRKPDPRIYELAMERLNDVARRKGVEELKPGEVLFLDDIAGNLKAARALGMMTMKVELGAIREAVVKLENVLRMELLEKSGAKL